MVEEKEDQIQHLNYILAALRKKNARISDEIIQKQEMVTEIKICPYITSHMHNASSSNHWSIINIDIAVYIIMCWTCHTHIPYQSHISDFQS